jgi:hypothetical protein
LASKLIALNAAHHEVIWHLGKSDSLASFRLRARLYASMLLEENASKALLFVSDEDFQTSGATLADAKRIMKDVLHLAHVTTVQLLKRDENNKILKSIEGNRV